MDELIKAVTSLVKAQTDVAEVKRALAQIPVRERVKFVNGVIQSTLDDEIVELMAPVRWHIQRIVPMGDTGMGELALALHMFLVERGIAYVSEVGHADDST